MNKKTLIALGVFALLLGAVLFLQSRPEQGERVYALDTDGYNVRLVPGALTRRRLI